MDRFELESELVGPMVSGRFDGKLLTPIPDGISGGPQFGQDHIGRHLSSTALSWQELASVVP